MDEEKKWDGEERRSETRDINFLLGKIVSRLTAIESNLDTKVSSVCDDVTELKQADDKKHIALEQKIAAWIRHEFMNISNKLDLISTWNTSVNLSIQKLDKRIDDQDTRIKKLEDAGKDKVYSMWKKVGDKLLWIVLGVIGAAILYAIAQPSFWTAILSK